jgi:hypothetical protein
LPVSAAPWLLGTDAVERRTMWPVPSPLGRVSGSTVAALCRDENVVDVRNRASIRWLRWLGFTLSDPVEFGGKFRLFELRSA